MRSAPGLFFSLVPFVVQAQQDGLYHDEMKIWSGIRKVSDGRHGGGIMQIKREQL